ncbi:C6 transcription factor [Cordyceps militaris CM01]|uniref:C6 transcription factor n=1 Tax=Cordyceps militaris (strain CM01) TaxID=983644 RepID=G3JKM1_CORMM|nr:C6 transcription factor [Cordyceps militaris CM01]EGX91460.1 C6 transcription factor [Cordyceps militaris CM01]
MGSSTTFESLPRMALPDTPPELASPTATSFSSRSSPSADHVWASQALASLPMSKYDQTPGRDEADDRRESTPLNPSKPAERLQLPPFSSLLDPPSSMRPLNPLHGRPSHYPMHSPLDRPHALTPAPSQNSSLYFPSPAAQPRTTYDASAHEMGQSYSGSRSPRMSESRNQTDRELAWSHHETGRHEYMLGTQSTTRRHLPESRDGPMDDKKEQQPSSHSQAANASESAAPKNSLGPKIWTGNHFLPRFVRTAEVEGEGLCYFYDDETHCKTVIDGEAVNALWGVTKAGKPRKRLAIACVTCREKKIKCDPDFPRCVQCDKFGRTCKFKNAPRGGQTASPSTQPAELYSGKAMSSPRGSRDSRSPAAQLACHPSFDDSHHKRLKLGAETYSPSRGRSLAVSDAMDHSKSPQPSYRRPSDTGRISDEVLCCAWHTDVYASNPPLITDVVTKFFYHIESTMLLKFLPQTIWEAHLANSSHRKLPEDLMLLYSVLTVGVALSDGSRDIASEYAQVAHYAQKNLGMDCLQLVQSRILLAAYYMSVDRVYDANELLSSAWAAAASLQLNVELDKSTEANMTTYPFGMTRTGYKESRRRTLWSLFMLERFNGIFPNRCAMVNVEHLYIRLPTDNQSFENQIERTEPLFDPYSCTASTSLGSHNVLASLVEITYLWSECQATLYRIASRPAAAADESTRIQTLARKIRSWFASLPEHLTFSPGNLKESLYSGSVGAFVSLHLLYHHAMIKVNRHHHSAGTLLGSQVQSCSAHKCFGHASGILELLQEFETLRRSQMVVTVHPRVASLALVDAVDTLTANGTLASLSSQINSSREALAFVEQLSHTWEDMARSKAVILKRLDDLLYIRKQGPRPASPMSGYRILSTSGDCRWQICEPIDSLLPKEMDIVYTMPL